jgi:hypothetical protein
MIFQGQERWAGRSTHGSRARRARPTAMQKTIIGYLCLCAALTAYGATTYYVDSIGGQNSNPGTSPEAAWQDFSNINGRTLTAGERLLIKRGSVINQELNIEAHSTPEQWAEIGTYGEGARPLIRRNGYIGDRCVLVRNPDYLCIRSLAVSHAGKGLIVGFAAPGHSGLVIEDCIAHHIEGQYRTDSSGIPEWRNFHGLWDGVPGAPQLSPGIGVMGAGRDITIRDCEVFQNSWGFCVQGSEQVKLERVYCHHNYAFNTSPHPALISVTNVIMQNCIFDTAGYHAHAGTMGIMLVTPINLVVRNCIFRNQPDSGCHDEGGIDFEAHGENCVIENCTFQNNAGAAIEVLGLSQPQPKNVEIRHSRFIQNNWANKLGPSEIFIWGAKVLAPKVCCSTGTIRDNGYVLLPGVQFFTNQAPATTQWTLANNTAYASVKALDKAMPLNNPPMVVAGDDIISDRAEVRLRGRVSDDGRPTSKKLAVRWELLDGPGPVTFADSASAKCDAVFAAPGDYLLRLVGDDGELWTSSMVAIHVVPRGISVAKAWEFNRPLEKEGWTEADLGTQNLTNKSCISYPVHYVAGGYYIVALENAPNAHLLSADELGVSLKRNKTVRLRLQNHTTATNMTLRFVTHVDGTWDEAKSKRFAVTPNDNGLRAYVVDMSTLPGWTGKLRQLRLDLTGGEPATGTCRIDYIWIDDSKPATP